MATKAVAKKQDAALAAWGDYSSDTTGFEGTDRSELAIPFINLLQSNSEKVEDGDATAGQFYNNVMETVSDSLSIVPCARQRVFVEWVPVDDGGGLVAVHDPDSQHVQDAIRDNNGSTMGLKCADGTHDLVETVYLYALILTDDGDAEQAVISFSSSKLKKYRQFWTKAKSLTMMIGDRRIKLPLWSVRWKLTSSQEVAKSNGKKFQNLNLSLDGDNVRDCVLTPDTELFQAGEAFQESVIGGLAKADMSTADTAVAKSDSDEIPF